MMLKDTNDEGAKFSKGNSRHVHYILNIIGRGLTSNEVVYLFGVRL